MLNQKTLYIFLFGLISSLLQRSSPFNEERASRNFITNYEATYGRNHPNFFQDKFKQAVETCKESSKFLFVYFKFYITILIHFLSSRCFQTYLKSL